MWDRPSLRFFLTFSSLFFFTFYDVLRGWIKWNGFIYVSYVCLHSTFHADCRLSRKPYLFFFVFTNFVTMRFLRFLLLRLRVHQAHTRTHSYKSDSLSKGKKWPRTPKIYTHQYTHLNLCVCVSVFSFCTCAGPFLNVNFWRDLILAPPQLNVILCYESGSIRVFYNRLVSITNVVRALCCPARCLHAVREERKQQITT